MEKFESEFVEEIKEAASGDVRYGETVVLHESRVKRVEAIPFYYDTSSGPSCSIKFNVYDKRKLVWMINPKQSLTLKEVSAARLVDHLTKILAVSCIGSTGKVVARSLEGGIDVKGMDDDKKVELMSILLQDDALIRKMADGFLPSDLNVSLDLLARRNEMRNAISRLRQIVESEPRKEKAFQDWCEQHIWVFGNYYAPNSDEARMISPQDELDLMVQDIHSGFQDIIELKTADVKVILYDRSRSSYYFSSEVSQVIGQCHKYIDVFQKYAENGLHGHTNLLAHHPKAIAVIGRSNEWTNEEVRAFRGLNSRLHGISVMTYDHLIARGEQMLEIMNGRLACEKDMQSALKADDDQDQDDIGF